MPYVIFNRTDGIPAGYQEWDTRVEAEKCIERMREGFRKAQGYYRTSRMEKIAPEDIQYEIVELNEEEEQDGK